MNLTDADVYRKGIQFTCGLIDAALARTVGNPWDFEDFFTVAEKAFAFSSKLDFGQSQVRTLAQAIYGLRYKRMQVINDIAITYIDNVWVEYFVWRLATANVGYSLYRPMTPYM